MPVKHLPYILIVDDHEVNLEILENIIGKLKVKLVRAVSGTEALQKTKRIKLALAIIDVKMPGMNGYELAEKLNSERPGEKIPIIFLTANQSDEIEIGKGYSLGAVDYIFKPVNAHFLKSKIGVFLDLFNQNTTILKDAALLKKSADKMSRVIAALKKSDERYRNYVNNAPDGVFVTDETGKFLEVNRALCRITGYSKDELLTRSLPELLPEESLSKGLAKFVKDLKSGQIKAELQFMHKNGSRRWWTLDAVILSKNRFLYFTKDIPDYKRVNEALWDTDLQMERIVKGANVGAMEWNVQSGETLVNEEFANILGYTHAGLEDVIGISRGWAPDELFSHPDEKIKTLEKLERHFSGELPYYDNELRIKHKDGHWMWVNDRARVITRTVEGKPLIMSGTRTNITERKEAEEALRESEETIAESQRIAHIGSWKWDIQSDTIRFSKEMYNVYGISPASFDGGFKSLNEFLHPDDVELFNNKIKASMSGANPSPFEYRVIHKDGSVHNLYAEVRIEFDRSGIPVTSIGTVQDITERKIAEKEKNVLEQLQQLTQYTEKARENERAAISRELHDDLGQALTAVKIDMGMIRSSISDQGVVSQINKVTALVSDTIKTVQRITSNLRPDIIYDLGLETAIEWYTKQYAERYGKEVILELDPAISFSSEDSLTLFRIMQESLTNVARHSEATRVIIALCKEGDKVIFCISDNGIGITDSQRNAKNSFGIISMNERAASLQAKFDVSSKKGGGTVIKLMIPLKNQQA